MAEELPHLRIYTMAISDDEQGKIIFMHRVTPGCIGRSYGVHVAKLAGMPPSIVKRAEEVLKGLETAKDGLAFAAFAHNGHAVTGDKARVIAEGNGHYEPTNPNGGTPFIASENSSKYHYAWQSEQARMVASTLERSEGAALDIDEIDVCAITPLDALNLLSLMQKQRKAR